MRTLLAAAFAASLLVTPATVAAYPLTAAEVHDGLLAGGTTTAQSTSVLTACSDEAYNLIGPRWDQTLNWYFAAFTTPAGLVRSSVRDVIKKGFANVTDARNDCALADNVSATAAYKGTTSRRPNCSSSDGYNVVGFKSLPAGTLAVACYWYSGTRMVEADIQINSSEPWALSLATCVRRSVLESTVTHEVGHAFGLAHVGELTHGDLTMSPKLNGLCNNEEATLGRGDVMGLEQLY